MIFHPLPAPGDGDDPDEAMAARHSRMLAELGDIAMQLARAAGRRALAQAEATEAQADDRGDAGRGDLGLAFTRIARCVRQTLAQEAKLARARTEAVSARPVWTQPDGGVEAVHEKLRRLMMAGLDDDDEIETTDPDDREDLLADLHERLDDADAAGRAALPTGEAIARLRRDLDGFSGAAGEMRADPLPFSEPFPAPRSEPAAGQPAPAGRRFRPP